MGELCAEVTERLEKDRETVKLAYIIFKFSNNNEIFFQLQNQRTAKLLTVTVRLDGDIRPSSYTRSLALPSSYDKELMTSLCLAVMNKENSSKQPNTWNPMVVCLGVSASKFVDVSHFPFHL